MGVTRIEQYLATFSELAPGIATGCRDMNVPLFVTAERAKMVAFSVHVRESPVDFSWASEIQKDSTAVLQSPGTPMRVSASLTDRYGTGLRESRGHKRTPYHPVRTTSRRD
nr:hypothetical protein [Burkholderia diffusa]